MIGSFPKVSFRMLHRQRFFSFLSFSCKRKNWEFSIEAHNFKFYRGIGFSLFLFHSNRGVLPLMWNVQKYLQGSGDLYVCSKLIHNKTKSCTFDKSSFYFVQEKALDQPEISFMKPGKNDHYTKKVNGEKTHVQTSYLLWPLRDVLNMLNESDISVGDSFKELSFTLFYKFIKARKQCIFNWKISQNICLCETCENAVLLVRSLNQACKELKPCDPHAIVKEYSCNSKKKDCMLSICEECKSHGLEQNWTTSTKKRWNRRKWWW